MFKIISNPLQAMKPKVQAQPVLKLKYFQCKKNAEHNGQVLNYVCIQKSCSDRGLICSVCKNDHNGHKVVPLKYLLSSLKHHKQNSNIKSQSFQTQLQEIQKIKNQYLLQLKQIVIKMSQKIQKIEQEIIQMYKKRKIQLLNQIQIKMKFNHIIEETINNKIVNQEEFQKDFKIISSLVEVNNQNNNPFNFHNNYSNTNNFYFSVNLAKIVQDYQTNFKSFSNKINHFYQNDYCPKFNTLLQQNISKISEPKLIQQPKKVQLNNLFGSDTNTSNKQLKFNPLFKGSNLSLSNNNKTAECTLNGNQRFALVDGVVGKSGSIIRFKVQKLKNWVGFGLGIRNIIKTKGFKFQYNNLGHGSYLLSNNNYMWSHSFAANNIQPSDFSFIVGNIIKVQVKQKELIFTNESQGNKTKKLPIQLTEQQWKQACFCVNLCSIGDAATIVS